MNSLIIIIRNLKAKIRKDVFNRYSESGVKEASADVDKGTQLQEAFIYEYDCDEQGVYEDSRLL